MTHEDEARRIAPPESYGTLCNEIAAALAAAERAGIERAESALRKRADELSAADADGNCREVGALVGAAILVSALLPAAVAEPAAKSLQDEIGAWGDVTFPNSTQQTIIAHLRSEVNEEIAPDCDPEELADAAMLVMQLAHKRKLNLDALLRAKFEKNKRRKWAWDEKAGFSRHVKETEPAAKCGACLGTNSVIEREEQVRNESGVFEWHVHRGPCPACAGGGK